CVIRPPPPPTICTLFPYTTLFRSHFRKESDVRSLFPGLPAGVQPFLQVCFLCPAGRDLQQGDLQMIHCRSSRASVRPLLKDVQRSEEHTSELQSRFDLVCRLLLEK